VGRDVELAPSKTSPSKIQAASAGRHAQHAADPGLPIDFRVDEERPGVGIEPVDGRPASLVAELALDGGFDHRRHRPIESTVDVNHRAVTQQPEANGQDRQDHQQGSMVNLPAPNPTPGHRCEQPGDGQGKCGGDQHQGGPRLTGA
jgi:hypothetical protein